MGSVFDIPYQELKQWGPGELVDHDKLNQPVDALNSLRRVGVNPPTQVIGTVRAPTVAVTVASLTEHRVLRLVAHKGDYLECEDDNRLVPDPDNPDGPDIPEKVNVAKVWLLRRTSLDLKRVDGWLYEYTSESERTVEQLPITPESRIETHRITPPYILDGVGAQGQEGEQIVAARIDLGVSTDEDAQGATEPILWAYLADTHVWTEVTE